MFDFPLPPIENVYTIERPSYYVIRYIKEEVSENYGILIFDLDNEKYMFYIIDGNDFSRPMRIEKIVFKYHPLPLDVAKRNFPQMNITKENYGY